LIGEEHEVGQQITVYNILDTILSVFVNGKITYKARVELLCFSKLHTAVFLNELAF